VPEDHVSAAGAGIAAAGGTVIGGGLAFHEAQPPLVRRPGVRGRSP
jgi:hypothetical protein